MRAVVPRIMIAGTASGAGKTTVACGLMRLLTLQGLRVQACKVGPDYLDPTFHTSVLKVPSRTIDLFLGDENLARTLLAEDGQKSDLTVLEGVMGYYDGIAASDAASSYAVARATDTPVLLVVDGRGRALSIAAEIAGFMRFRNPSQIKGVILNQVSPAYYQLIKDAIERETSVSVVGYVPRLQEAELPSRHLGLVSADEVGDLSERMDALARTLEETLDTDAILALANGAPELTYEPDVDAATHGNQPRVAVAKDEAFSFYYPDTLALLERLGAQLVFVSPLNDVSLPSDICGLYLGGGYPELHAQALSANQSFLASVRKALAAGMPTIAECGGFLYLQQELTDAHGDVWPMVGALDGSSSRGAGLRQFGYVTLTALCDNLLTNKGEELPAHEFHYWQSTQPGCSFHAQKPQSNRGWDCVVATDSLYAGFPHLYLRGVPHVAQRFVDACVRWQAREKGTVV